MLAIIICVLSLLILFKIYLKMTHKTYIAQDKMTGKVVIITGSNPVVFATAKNLAARGAKVILASKSEASTIQTVCRIQSATGNDNVHHHYLDLSSFKSVRSFAKYILRTEPLLDVLINSAVVKINDNSLTRDDLPKQSQMNHFSPFLLTMLLLPLLKCSAPSRIINVSSLLYRFGSIDNLNKQWNSWLISDHICVYSDTKFANILFTKKLSEHLRGTGVTVNCLYPSHITPQIFRFESKIINHLLNLIFLSAEEEAQTAIFLSVAKELEQVTGKYFSNCTVTTPTKRALDDEAANKLWKLSQDVTFRYMNK